MKRKLSEIGFIGYPSDTGMTQRFFAKKKGNDFPYDDPSLSGDHLDPTGIQPDLHTTLTPKDTSHSVWDDALKEFGGSPTNIAKSSPGQMSRVVPGGNPWAGNPFDDEVDDDELSKAGHVKEDYYDGYEKSFESPPSDDDLAAKISMGGGHQDFPGSPLPSDIMVFGNDPFSQGLGQPMQGHRDLFGIMDGVGELPEKTVWSYLEQLIVGRIVGK